MELTVLGTCGAFPGPGRAATGYLLQHDGFNLAVDMGNGALANLQRAVPYQGIDAVLVSHSHPDHCVDIYALFIARKFHPEPLAPIPLAVAPGVFDRIASLGSEVEEMRQSFEVRPLEPGQTFELGPFRIEARPMTHWVPALGYRIQADGRNLAYTGDTGPTEELEVLGRSVDMLITEASWLEGQERGRDPFHLTARQAAEHAARAGAGHLVLSHFWPTNDRERSREEAAPAFGSPITLADEGMRLEP
jgi:ribonuclease BN (tRNA processing enzyme)